MSRAKDRLVGGGIDIQRGAERLAVPLNLLLGISHAKARTQKSLSLATNDRESITLITSFCV